MYNIFVLMALFLVYSFIGWVMETCYCWICTKKFVNRGFLIGPVLPIYGTGGVLVYVLLKRYLDMPLVLFIMSIIICSLLEYFTSYYMEKLFKTRWWDYSNRKFNINGRVCLFNMICFGILSLVIMYGVNPFLLDTIHKIDPMVLKTVVSILMTIFLIDLGISTKIIYNFKGISKNILTDATEEVNKKVKEVILSKGVLLRRIAKSYPNFKIRR